MENFFQELGKKLAEKWVSLLLLPGLLFVAAARAGAALSQRDAVDHELLLRTASDTMAALARMPVTSRVVAAVGLLLAAAGVGLAVQALAGVTQRIWLGAWPRPFAPVRRRLVARRFRRWHQEVARRRELERSHPGEWRTREQQSRINAAADRINRLALAEPARPTWMGDRIQAVEQVALHRSGLDLAFAWPRLWLVLPDTVRGEITAAHAGFARAAATGSWAWPYFFLGAVWWPAALIGAVIGTTGWARARAAVSDLSALSEAAVDLHARTLATALGISADATGPITIAEGERITALVRKGR
ncbi:hypothetical protein [Streptomyces sp. SLBN-115]|uniref:hypothetical protein n=1 Tax=Streptomyces sp. SLBN-115 TaxID=2768453 RepID=UPI001151E42F|nr:hypothetical protein [Streptomyces sp. SLBN-115]TQJ37626.1 hypothetical protein FBY34_8465 [Streptomyces sp. SLBN-115]